jgi:hypothetical protein
MLYLTENDLLVVIQDYTLQDILETTGSTLASPILQSAEKVAIDTVKAYVSNIYDTDNEFSLTGSTRNGLLVNCVVNLVQYYLYQRVSSDIRPEHIDLSYERTMENLRDIQNRKVVPKVTRLSDSDSNYVPRIVSTSNTRVSYNY